MDKPRWIYVNVVISKITYDQAIEKWNNNENVYLYYSEDFKDAIDRYTDKIKNDKPKVIFKIDMMDVNNSNVLVAVDEISKYIIRLY